LPITSKPLSICGVCINSAVNTLIAAVICWAYLILLSLIYHIYQVFGMIKENAEINIDAVTFLKNIILIKKVGYGK